MTESSIASAVALPEPPQYPGPDALQKRRQSVSSENSSKRRRLSADGASEHAVSSATPSSTSNTRRTNNSADGKAANQRKPGVEEERKRGRRLFGALLGTLSQSPSSPAQRQRSEIDRKQQEKLKLQDKEHNELTKKKYEDLMAARRKDQILYNEQSMKLHHSNMLAMAHSLRTKAEPPLYYRPWYLRPQDELKIQDQIAEAKMTIAKEIEDANLCHKPQHELATDKLEHNVAHSDLNTAEAKDTENLSEAPQTASTKTFSGPEIPITSLVPTELDEEHSGEVLLEDNEDAVIY
ncbi:pinin/SDK/memA domain-containing protein [Arthroderma uncinatum]|uniref:pinin/SDK/memA domain-containing protein n=1 Tax=Arthroderma uncinatum TaxID=74035 RepID=UPI00144ADE86|nr:pinin/SDK/memA domain-containing protein [Arthroderma uncinatum]KAF3483335.1 pinin/SDK/memA domain-containing protein [Arthroderma uncinatum]